MSGGIISDIRNEFKRLLSRNDVISMKMLQQSNVDIAIFALRVFSNFKAS